MSKKYSKSYEIRYQDVDYTLKCKLASIMNFLCDIGNSQSEEVGDTIEHLTESRVAWVFYKYDIKVKRYPKYGEKIKVVTMPKSFKKFYASRGYEIYDKNNEKIVEGEGIFLLIDIDKRRVIRIPEEQYIVYGIDIENCPDIKLTKLEKLTKEMNKNHFKVRYGDIDSNMHVNNVKYVEWAVESLPLEVILNYQLEELSVIFEKECRYGAEIIASYEIKENESGLVILHKIVDNEDKELTVLISKWKKLIEN